jgi:hypothetical protein
MNDNNVREDQDEPSLQQKFHGLLKFEEQIQIHDMPPVSFCRVAEEEKRVELLIILLKDCVYLKKLPKRAIDGAPPYKAISRVCKKRGLRNVPRSFSASPERGTFPRHDVMKPLEI